jgi:septal ring factor EnvC (AmiA/AmiB activator)
MLGRLTLPPRLAAQVVSDIHDLAEGLRSLTERGGDIDDLISSVRVLPRVEDELSANIADLRRDLATVREQLARLERELGETNDHVKHLRDRLPGI